MTLLSSGIAVPAVHADTSPPPVSTGDWKPQSKRGFWDRLLGRHKVPAHGTMRQGPAWSPPGRSGTVGALARPKPPGKRVKELTGERTPTRTVFRLADGRVQADVSSVPVRYRDKAGSWRDIDTDVARSSDAGFSYGNDGTGFATRFGDRSDRLVRVELGGRGVTVGVVGPARRVTPKVSGSTVTYADAWDGADLVYEVTATGVKESIVVTHAPAADVSFGFTVKSDGVTARALPDGSVGFFAEGKAAAGGGPVFTIPRPFMTDARRHGASTPGQGLSDKVAMAATGQGATTTITITPDASWLAAAGRAYPVRVDPTITVQPDVATSQDAMIVSYAATTNYGSDPRLGAGVDKWGKVRSLLRFDLAALVPAGTPVDAASLSLYWDNTVLANTTSAPVALEARAVTGAWTPSTATWNSISAAVGDLAGTATFDPSQTNTWTTFPVTNVVRDWVSGNRPNNGFTIKAANEATSAGGPIYAAGEFPVGSAGDWPNVSTRTAPKLTLTFGLPAVQLDQPRTVHATGAELSWSAYQDPSAASGDDLVEYQLHRSTQAGFVASAATLVAPLPRGTTSYTDTTADPNTTQYYEVVVVRKDGQRSAAQAVSVRTPPAGYVDAYLQAAKDATITTCDYTRPHDLLSGRPAIGVGYVPGGYGTTRGLVKWDTAQIPKAARVVEATGQLWRTMYNGNAVYYADQALTREFDPASATWLNAATGTPWTAQGGDVVSNPIEVFGLAPTANSVWVNLNLTSQVRAWQSDPAGNHGVLLRLAQESNKSCPASGEGAVFTSSEAAEASVSPRLHVRYTDPSLTYTAPGTPSRLYAGETATVPVTVTNTTTQTWPAASTKLGYGWKRPDGTNATTAGSVVLTALPADLAPGQTVTVNAQVKAPALPAGDGNKAEAYTLAWDLTDTSTSSWMSATAQVPQLDQQIGVEDPTSDQLGMEPFYSYTSLATGAGGAASVNNYAGNAIWTYNPFTHPSRGPDTSLAMAYNSLDTSRSSMGFGWSLRAATLQRLGSRLGFSPPGQTWPTQVRLLDSDGTTSVFTLDTHGQAVKDCQPATCDYVHPHGVHLYLQRTGSIDPTRAWVFTAPDRTQFFFDADGYQSATVDKNFNTMSFVYEQRKSNNVPTKFLQRVVDAAGRTTLSLDWWTKGEDYTFITDTGTEASAANLTDPQIIDQVQSITDVDGRKITFTYTVQGLMAKMVDGAGNAQPKTFRFLYDMTQGNNNAKLLKVTDPRGHDTRFDYYYPQTGDDPEFHWHAKNVTDRLGGLTQFGYVDPDGATGTTLNTTVTDPETHLTRYHLDGFGRPTEITDAKNQTTFRGYDDDHNVTRLEEPPADPEALHGAVSTWLYDTVTGYPLDYTTAEGNANGWGATTFGYSVALNGHVADLVNKISPEGRNWAYGYDAFGNLTSATDPAGTATDTQGDYTTRYEYDAFGQLARTVDPNGHATDFSDYDASSRPQVITNADGKVSTFTYDARGNELSATDPLGHSKFQDYDLFGRSLASTEQQDAATGEQIVTPAPVYDPNDNVTTRTTAKGAAYTAIYDANDQVTSELAPRDDEVGAPERKTSYTYDKVGNQLIVTEPKGNLTATAGDYTTTYHYDEIYELTGVTDATGATTSYVYNGAGDISRVVDGHKNATPEDDFTADFLYTLDHQVSFVFDAGGFHTNYGYDHDGLHTTATDQNGSASTTVYDPRGLIIERRVPHTESDGQTQSTVTRYEYDQVGNRTKVISPRGVATSEPTDFLTETRYDNLNRPREVVYPYDKNAFDPEDRINTPQSVVYTYDDASRLSSIQLPPTDSQFNANPDQTGRITTKIDYFDNGWIKKTTDPFGVATGYEYNPLGEQTKRTVTAADGTQQRFLQWDYEPDGKMKHEADSGDGAIPPHLSAFDYAYDANGNLTTVNDHTDGATIDQWSIDYDQRNQVAEDTESLAGVVKNVTSYGYDENGALIHRVQDQGTDDFTYDVRNMLATARNTENSGVVHNTSFAYTPTGRLRQEIKSNGNVATYDYYLDDLLKHSVEKSTDGTVQDEHTLQYTPNLKISSDQMTVHCAGTCRSPDVTKNYTYDPRDRVTRVENTLIPSDNESYTYDANSNIIVQSIDQAPFSDAFFYDRNRLIKSGLQGGITANYKYDPSGRLQTVTGADDKTLTAFYGYDNFDHVIDSDQIGVDGADRDSQFTYDAFGRTSSNTTTTTPTTGDQTTKKTVFNYLGLSGEVLDEQASNDRTQTDGALTQWFDYSANDERLGMNKIVNGAVEHTDYGYNSHGDVEYITDDNGQTKATYGYSSYGSLVQIPTTGVDVPDSNDPYKEPYNPYWYNSARFDKVGNTYDMNAQGYQPDLHRFLTPQTSDDATADVGVSLNPATSNRYGFAGGNPIANLRYTPPFNWKKALVQLGVGLIVGAAVTTLAALCPETAGITCVAGAWVAGGAAAGAASYTAGYLVDPSQGFNWADFGIETGIGAAIGLISFGVGKLFGAEGPLFNGRGKDWLKVYADALRGPNKAATPRVAAEYTSPSGETYYGRSGHGLVIPRPLRVIMEQIAPLSTRHGACAEVHCLIKAFQAEGMEGIQGGTMRAVRVRSLASGGTAHGTPIAPCADYCTPLLQRLGIKY